MTGTRGPVFIPDRLGMAVSLALLALAATSWIGSYYLMPLMASGSGMMSSGVSGIVSSLSFVSVGYFEIVWVIGMMAMMSPAMIPMVAFYNRVVSAQDSNPLWARIAGTFLFLGGYLLMYAALGLVAFLTVYEGFSLSTRIGSLAALSAFAPGTILVATGAYQLTPLKSKSLSKCVSPFGFFVVYLRKGPLGSIRMGIRHGVYCVGCCWAFMLVMLAVGAMSIPVMAVLAGVIALEKVIVRGAAWFTRVVAGLFIATGVVVLIFPNAIALI